MCDSHIFCAILVRSAGVSELLKTIKYVSIARVLCAPTPPAPGTAQVYTPTGGPPVGMPGTTIRNRTEKDPHKFGSVKPIFGTGTPKTTRLATFFLLFPQRWTVDLWSWVGNVRALPGVFVGGDPASGACAAASPVLAAKQKMFFKRPDVPGAPSSHPVERPCGL